MSYFKYDEFIFYKGSVPYEGEYTVPGTAAAAENIPSVLYVGSQRSPIVYDTESSPDIDSTDFFISVDFYLTNLYPYVDGYSEQVYYIISQLDESRQNGWAITLVFDADYNATIHFTAWSAGAVVCSIYKDVDFNFDTASVKTNQDSTAITIGVARYEGEARIFVDGIYSDSTTSSGTIGTLSTENASLEVNGLSGIEETSQPLSQLAVGNIAIFDYALYWDDYALMGIEWGQAGGIVIFPMVEVNLLNGERGDINASLPILIRVKGDMAVFTMEGSLPLSFGMSGEIAPYEEGTFGISIDLIEGTFSGEIYPVGIFGFAIPELEGEFTVTINEGASFAVTLPLASPEFQASSSIGGTFNIDLPSFASILNSAVGAIGTFNIVLPAISFSPQNSTGVVGTFNITIPFQRGSFGAALSANGTIDIEIPALLVEFASGEGDYKSMIINLKNSALTELDVDANSMGHFRGKNLYATPDGIYEMNSVTDWYFTTEYFPVEKGFKVRLKQAWVSCKFTENVIVTVMLPDGSEYEYALESYSEGEYNSRVKFGKGIRTKFLKIKFSGSNSFELDEIKLHYDKTDKKR